MKSIFEDILALIRSLSLPKELLVSVENHPMYNELTKTLKHEIKELFKRALMPLFGSPLFLICRRGFETLNIEI